MAPEQASGRTEEIDERTDVYALGAILYELLTGHIPFEGQTADDIQQRVLDEEVRPLRQWDARIPRPWEAICLKSLAKSPADRFPSARALREDIERILADQPASAYRESPWERLTRWARRHRTFTLAAAGTLGAMVVVLAATLAVIAESRAREAAARRDADYQRDEAKRQADLASQRLDQVLHETYNVEMLRVRDIWRSEPAEALAALDDQRRCPPAMRDFTWGLYHRLANRQRWSATRHKGFISAIAISPDGQTIASGGADQIIRLWDSASGAERRQLTGNRGWVIDLAFAPAGETLVSAGADGTIRQWNVADGKPLREIAAHESHVNALVLMPEANRVVSGGADGHVKVWSLADGKLLSHAKSVEGEVLDLAYLPATRSIASAGDDGMIQIWDQDLQKSRPLVKHTAAVQALASIRDGRQLASASHDGMILLWDVASGSVTRSMPGHHNRVSALAATTTGGLLASASWDKTVRLWNLQADDSPVTLSGHTATALSVALAPDRSWLASGDSEGRIVNWTTDPGASQATWRDEPAVLALAFDDRQEELFCAGGDHLLVAPRGYIHRWSITQSRLDDKLLGHTLTVTALDVAPARRWLASASADRTIRLWDLDSLRELRHVGSHDGYVWSIAFAPHAPCLASGGDKVVRLWDVASGRLVRELAGPTAMVQRVAFDPSGRWLAAVDWGRTVIVWSAGDGREVWRWKNKEAGLPFVAFAGERRLITSKNETALAAWELPGGALIAEFVGHDAPLSAVCVSPDCRTVASADRSGTIQLWDAEHGQERALLAGHTSAILALQFSPDNRKLASADDSGMVKVWQSDPPSRE
jgi:WD40 repeat protein